MPEALFWRSTVLELRVLLAEMGERRIQQERAETMRAGLIAAAVYNAAPFRGEGAKIWQATDFLPKEPKILSPAEFAQTMKGWARDHNASERRKVAGSGR